MLLINCIVTSDKLISHLERVLMAAAGLCLLFIMVIVAFDVALRYVFSSPLTWTYSVVGSYLIVGIFYFAISTGLKLDNHIAITVFQNKLPRRFIDASLALAFAASALFMVLIAIEGYENFRTSFANREIISMTIPWPTWPTFFVVSLGSILMAIRCFLIALRAGIAVFVFNRDSSII